MMLLRILQHGGVSSISTKETHKASVESLITGIGNVITHHSLV